MLRNPRNLTYSNTAYLTSAAINFSNFPQPSGLHHLLHSGSLLRLTISVNVAILTSGREVLQASLGVGLHSLATILPSGRADLAVFVGELERLDETDRLLDVAADRKVVDCDLAKHTLGVDDEEATQSYTLILDEDTVATRDLVGLVGN